jgi:hypothetical protein
MVYSYKAVPIMQDGLAMDFDILTTLANNDNYFNRVTTGMDVSLVGAKKYHATNSFGSSRFVLQSGSILLPAIKKELTKTVPLTVNPVRWSWYPIFATIRDPHSKITASVQVVSGTPKSFTVVIRPNNATTTYTGVFLDWMAVTPLSG